MLDHDFFCYFPVSTDLVEPLIHGHVPAFSRESSSVVLRALRREEGAGAGAHGCCWLSPCVCSRRRRRGAQSYCRPANSLLCVLTAPGGATSPRPSYWQPSDAISIPRAARRSPRGSFQRAALSPCAQCGMRLPRSTALNYRAREESARGRFFLGALSTSPYSNVSKNSGPARSQPQPRE